MTYEFADICEGSRQGLLCTVLAERVALQHTTGTTDPEFLRGRGWVRIGSLYATDSKAGTLDSHLKKAVRRRADGIGRVRRRPGALVDGSVT